MCFRPFPAAVLTWTNVTVWHILIRVEIALPIHVMTKKHAHTLFLTL